MINIFGFIIKTIFSMAKSFIKKNQMPFASIQYNCIYTDDADFNFLFTFYRAFSSDFIEPVPFLSFSFFLSI